MTAEREIEQQRQVIWAVLKRLGGSADISWADMAAVPQFPPLTIRTTETGFVISAPEPSPGTREA